MPTLLVPKPQFPLKYAVEDAGPNGPETVELWVTQDGGRTWFPKGVDADRTSPFPVDLGGEGTFGLRLVSRSASGLGDQQPKPGDPPEMLVEVDSTEPTVQILPPQVGTGPNLGKVLIRWRASDTAPLGPARRDLLASRPARGAVAADHPRADRQQRFLHLARPDHRPPPVPSAGGRDRHGQ